MPVTPPEMNHLERKTDMQLSAEARSPAAYMNERVVSLRRVFAPSFATVRDGIRKSG